MLAERHRSARLAIVNVLHPLAAIVTPKSIIAQISQHHRPRIIKQTVEIGGEKFGIVPRSQCQSKLTAARRRSDSSINAKALECRISKSVKSREMGAR